VQLRIEHAGRAIPDTLATPQLGFNGAGFVARTTSLRVPGPVASVSLIPSSFDLAAFNETFRVSQLLRWAEAPPLTIQTRALQFTGVNNGDFTALADQMTDAESARLVITTAHGLRRTGGLHAGRESGRLSVLPRTCPRDEVDELHGRRSLAGGADEDAGDLVPASRQARVFDDRHAWRVPAIERDASASVEVRRLRDDFEGAVVVARLDEGAHGDKGGAWRDYGRHFEAQRWAAGDGPAPGQAGAHCRGDHGELLQ
jgi:hypothetical protein